MTKILAPVAVALAVALAGTALTTAPTNTTSAKGSGKGGTAGQLKVEGNVTAVNTAAGTVSITNAGGVTVVLTVNAATKIERNALRSTLAALRVGDIAQAVYAAGGLASKVEAIGA